MEVRRGGHLLKLLPSRVRGGWLVVDVAVNCDYARWWSYQPDALRDMSQRLALLDCEEA